MLSSARIFCLGAIEAAQKRAGVNVCSWTALFLYFEPGVIGMQQIVRQIKPEVEGGYRKRERWDEKQKLD